MAERKELIKRPGKAGVTLTAPTATPDFALPEGDNGPLADFFLGLAGDQTPGSGASAIGALAGILPVGKLLKMLPGIRPAQLEQVATEVLTAKRGASAAGRVLRRDVPEWDPQTQLMKEIEDRKLRGGAGSLAEFNPMPESNPLSTLPREEIDRAIDLTQKKPPMPRPPDAPPPKPPRTLPPPGPPLGKPKRKDLPVGPSPGPGPLPPKRNRGSVDEPHDGGLPKHKEVIPPFRSKSGIALDVLGDMDDHKYEFANSMTELRPDNIATDPVDYVANLKGLDDQVMSPRVPTDPFKFGNKLEKDPALIDMLIQDLSNYFTSPKFDPFHAIKKGGR